MGNISDNRTSLIRKNTIASFIIKGWAGGIQLMLVPLTLACLGNYVNGLWMIIASMLVWIDNLDIGLGNGLRNKLAEAMAEEDKEKGRQYVSTTFFLLSAVMLIVSIVILISFNSLDVFWLLSVDSTKVAGFREILILSMIVTCITFVFKLTGNVYLAMQLPAISNAIVVTGQTFTLMSVVALFLLHSNSLFYMASAYVISPLVINVCAFLYTFTYRYPELKPTLSKFRREYVKELASLGIKFFLLQIAAIVLFMSSNLIISKLFSPEAVTPYQIAYRLFSISSLIFTIIATPYWSATTDACKRGDIAWIRQSMKKLHILLVGLAVILIVMVACSSFIYRFWVGSEVDIPFILSVLMAVYMFEIIYSQTYSIFLNGMGHLNLQLMMTTLAAVSFVPMAIVFAGKYGLYGVCLAMISANALGLIVNILQFNYVISRIKIEKCM